MSSRDRATDVSSIARSTRASRRGRAPARASPASRSTATIGRRPASRAAGDHLQPDAAAADHARRSRPAATRATLRTAPTPVTTPQPSSAACHSGSSVGIGTAPRAATTQRSAKHAVMQDVLQRRAVRRARSRDVPSISIPAQPCSPAGSHRLGRPARQAGSTARGHEAERDARRPGRRG